LVVWKIDGAVGVVTIYGLVDLRFVVRFPQVQEGSPTQSVQTGCGVHFMFNAYWGLFL